MGGCCGILMSRCRASREQARALPRPASLVSLVSPRDLPPGARPCRAAGIARWIGVMRLIRCTIDPRIDRIARISHVNFQLYE